MAERRIKHVEFTYYEEVTNAGQTAPSLAVRHAYRDQTVDIPRQEDIDRGERFGAFYTEDEAVHVPAAEGGEPEEQYVGDMSDADLVAWIRDDKPNAQEVINAAGGDPEQARRLLAAEAAATGNDPRKTVSTGLTAVINRANQ